MKFFKNFFVFFLVLLFVALIPISCRTSSNRRDLSTPLSRLVGHWQDSNGFHYYFTPVDPSSRIGLFTGILSDKEKVMNFFRELTGSQVDEKAIPAEKFIGIAASCQYKVLFHIPEVNKVKITLLWPEASRVLGWFFPIEATFYVEKNGKQMLFNGEFREFGELINPIKYIDSKTSPEH